MVGAGPTKTLGPGAVGRDGRKVREYLGVIGPKIADLVSAIPDDLGELFWWRLSDYRCEQWVSGRVALLGDAACAFLPTAGVGASMALESAAVLNDELSRTDAKFLPAALGHYERRRKRRAEAFQDDSRKLGSMMMLDSAPMAWGRDQLLHFYTLEMLAKSITKASATRSEDSGREMGSSFLHFAADRPQTNLWQLARIIHTMPIAPAARCPPLVFASLS